MENLAVKKVDIEADRNSQHGQPMKNVEGATHPEAVARNPNIMGGGDYFR